MRKKFFVFLVIFFMMVSTNYEYTQAEEITQNNIEQSKLYIKEYDMLTQDSGPLGIDIASDNSVWFTMDKVGKIGVLFPWNGTIIEYERPNPELSSPYLIVDQQGIVWFTEYSEPPNSESFGRIVSFDPKTHEYTVYPIPTLNPYPWYIIEDRQGNIWFTEFLGNNLGFLNRTSGEIKEYSLSTELSGPLGIQVSQDNKIWLTESIPGRISVFDPKTETFEKYILPSDVNSPVVMVFGEDDSIWITDHGGSAIIQFFLYNDTIRRYLTSRPQEYAISLPNDLKQDSKGYLWATIHGGNKIAQINPKNGVIIEYDIPSGPLSDTLWMTIDEQDNIWFAEWTGNKIGMLNSSQIPDFSLQSEFNEIELSSGETKEIEIVLMGNEEIISLVELDAFSSLFSFSKVKKDFELKDETNTTSNHYIFKVSIDSDMKLDDKTYPTSITAYYDGASFSIPIQIILHEKTYDNIIYIAIFTIFFGLVILFILKKRKII